MPTSLATVSILALGIALCYGYKEYRDDIPNGYRIPNCCTSDPDDVWTRAGHLIEDTSCLRTTAEKNEYDHKNNFGNDYLSIKSEVIFRENIWQFLCEEDSDGDGRKNGDELGDPFCRWRKGMDSPEGILYHPGIPEEPNGSVSPNNHNSFCQCQMM